MLIEALVERAAEHIDLNRSDCDFGDIQCCDEDVEEDGDFEVRTKCKEQLSFLYRSNFGVLDELDKYVCSILNFK
jgi:hypothetical protein